MATACFCGLPLAISVLILAEITFLDAKDRQKILLLKEQRPDITILMLFQNANQKLYKGGKSTYGDWCTKNGIAWSHKIIKKEWLRGAA